MIASYPWLALVDVRVPLDGEVAILSSSGPIVAHNFVGIYPIVKPANAYNVLRLEDLKIPEGYEIDGESLKDAFRVPDGTTKFLSIGGILNPASDLRPYPGDQRRLCLRKIAPKTVQVLVIEYDSPTMALIDTAERALTASMHFKASRYRIEERPL